LEHSKHIYLHRVRLVKKKITVRFTVSN